MSEQTEKVPVPNLRFPEFLDSGEWKKEPLKHIADITMGSSPKSSSYNDNQHGLPLLQGNADIKDRLSAPRIFTSQITKECHIGDILLSVRAPVGTVAKSNHHACIGRGIAALRTKKQNSQEFLYQWLFSFEPWWQNISQGGTFDAVNSDDIKLLKTAIPKPDEQQKIADCLSSLDELITAHSQKHEALKAHKKGLMQQLFPAEGETLPKLRFPEFQDAGEWDEKKLGQIGEFTGGGTPSKSNEVYWNGKIPWISSSDISEDSIRQINISRFITEEALQQSATKLVPENSILLISRVGVGKLAITNKPVCTSQDFTNLTPAKDNLTFLAYYLKSIKMKLLSFSQGMAIKGFTKNDVSGLNILLPSQKEQQKIADCLSSIDDLITAQAQKIESLKVHKKGLMQQLFPAADEVGA